MTLTIIHPFMEADYGEDTVQAVRLIKNQQKNGKHNLLVTVDKEGKTSDLLKKNKISYEEVLFKNPVKPTDFYPAALFKIMTASLYWFCYLRKNVTNIVHFHGLTSLLSLGNGAKMYRLRQIYSLNQVQKYSHYATLTLKNCDKIVCPDEQIRSALPSFLSVKAVLNPQSVSETSLNDIELQTADSWDELYAGLCTRHDFTKTTGLLK